jgi:hypothetical protein
MEELIDTVLSVRTESRREAFQFLVKVISDSDVGEDLFHLYTIADQHDAAYDAYRPFEDHIIKLVDELLARMGAHFDYDYINENLPAIVGLFKLMDAIESFEDVDGLLAIVSSEEDDIVILHHLSAYIQADEASDYYGAFENLEARFISNVRENVVGRKKDLDNEVYFAERGKRLLNFLLDNPDIPFYSVFEAYLSLSNPNAMVEAFNFEETPVTLDKELITNLSIGVLIGTTDSQKEAISKTEEVVELLDQEEIFGIGDYADIRTGILKYYNPEEEEDETE